MAELLCESNVKSWEHSKNQNITVWCYSLLSNPGLYSVDQFNFTGWVHTMFYVTLLSFHGIFLLQKNLSFFNLSQFISIVLLRNLKQNIIVKNRRTKDLPNFTLHYVYCSIIYHFGDDTEMTVSLHIWYYHL